MGDYNEQEEREQIEHAVQQQGYTIEKWSMNDDEGRIQAHLGRVRALEDDENEGIYADTEGELHASCVGAKKHNNVRVAFHYYEDGSDSGMESRNPSMQFEVID